MSLCYCAICGVLFLPIALLPFPPIRFVKVAVISLPAEVMRGHLATVMEGLVMWCNEHRQRFRQKIRIIIEILLRHFTEEVRTRSEQRDSRESVRITVDEESVCACVYVGEYGGI